MRNTKKKNKYEAFYAVSVLPKTLYLQPSACCVLHTINNNGAAFWVHGTGVGPQALDFHKLQYHGVFGSSTATQ